MFTNPFKAMLRNTDYNSWKRNFFYYSGFNAKFRFPLIISIVIHLLFLLIALNTQEFEMINDFTVVIENQLPRKAVIKKIDKLVPVTDETLKNNKKDIKTGNKVESSSLIKDHNQKNSFNDEYEKMLFSKNKTSIDRKNDQRKTLNSNSRVKWQEKNRVEFDPEEKETREESVKAPGGEAASKSIKWKEGYARKIVFQPEIAYPLYFRKQGIQGSVIIQISVDAGGNVVSAEITKSSGYSKLDILGRNGIIKSRFSRKDNYSSGIDIADVEIQFKLER